jgi:glycine/D-amino acid oxidase-like deaminating enzyme
MKQAFDVALVGNGIIALSIAWELKRRDPALRIAILGPLDQLGAGSTAAGAMLGCFAEVTHRSLRSSAGKEKFKLGRLSSRRWQSWVNELNQTSTRNPPLEVIHGTIVIENAISDTLDSDNFDAIISALDDHNEPYELISPREIEGIHPVPSARPMRAIYLPNENAIDSREVLRFLRCSLRERGVTFLDQYCAGIDTASSQSLGITLRSGSQIYVAKAVCAAGAFSTPILDTVLDPTQVQPVFAASGIAFVSDRSDRKQAPSHTIRSVNRAGSCGLHVVHLDGARDYIGATNAIFDHPNTRATAGLSHFLLQCAIDQIDQWYAHAIIDHWRIGNRPVTLDTFPLIGASGFDDLFIATGTYRDGFHTSPIIAQIIGDEILDGVSRISHPFQPTRRPISVFSINESIAECSRHAMCTGFEASLVLPRLWPDEAFRAVFPTVNRRIYDALELDHGLFPDLVPFLNSSISSVGSDRAVFDRVKLVLKHRGMSQDISEG